MASNSWYGEGGEEAGEERGGIKEGAGVAS